MQTIITLGCEDLGDFTPDSLKLELEAACLQHGFYTRRSPDEERISIYVDTQDLVNITTFLQMKDLV